MLHGGGYVHHVTNNWDSLLVACFPAAAEFEWGMVVCHCRRILGTIACLAVYGDFFWLWSKPLPHILGEETDVMLDFLGSVRATMNQQALKLWAQYMRPCEDSSRIAFGYTIIRGEFRSLQVRRYYLHSFLNEIKPDIIATWVLAHNALEIRQIIRHTYKSHFKSANTSE